MGAQHRTPVLRLRCRRSSPQTGMHLVLRACRPLCALRLRAECVQTRRKCLLPRCRIVQYPTVRRIWSLFRLFQAQALPRSVRTTLPCALVHRLSLRAHLCNPFLLPSLMPLVGTDTLTDLSRSCVFTLVMPFSFVLRLTPSCVTLSEAPQGPISALWFMSLFLDFSFFLTLAYGLYMYVVPR